MITLEISFGSVVATLAVVGVAAYAFYRIGQKNMKEPPKNETPVSKYIKSNPNIIQAQRAFMENIDKLLPYHSGVTEIQIDKQGLTDAIIGINNEDLIAIWEKLADRPDLWLNQMAAWGVKPEFCLSFVAMEKHKALYDTADKSELELGEIYVVTSACWILTTNEDDRTIKKIVKKGTVIKKQ